MRYPKLIVFSISILEILSGGCEFEEINYQHPVPVALDASGHTSSGFLASWSPVEGGEKYSILVSTDNSLDVNKVVTGYPASSSKTSFWVGELEADQTYYYRVKVDNNNSKSEYSNVIAAKTLPLAAPQVITPNSITPLSFVARWRSVPEADGYLLYVSTNANFTEHLPKYNGKLVSDTVASVEDLKVNEDYFYRVRTVRGQSTSQTSDLVRVSTSRLAKPTLLDSSESSFTSITLNWEAVEGATSYKVFVATDRYVITDMLPEYNPRLVTDATSLVVLGLNANTTYYYRVQAINEQSESENSDPGSVSTVSLQIPLARTGTDIQIDGFQANWDSVTHASSYVLDISRNESFTDFLNGYRAKEVVDTLEIVTGLLRNTNYYYRIRAKGFGAVSGNSEVISVRTTFFASPKALEAIELQPTSFRAVWQPVEAADGYRLDVASDANFDTILPDYNNLAITDTTQLVTGLTENERYFYRVRALKGSVFSGYSTIIDLTTTRLSEPRLLATTDIDLTSFTINWQAVSGAVRYRVDVGFDPSVTNKIATDYDNRIVDNGTSLKVLQLNANTTYYFKVRAENNVSTGGSSLGSARTVSITPPAIDTPDNIELTSFEAKWGSVENASYLLDVATDENFTDLVAGFNARESLVTAEIVTGLAPNTTYYYRVRAKGSGSTSDYSQAATVTTSPLPAPENLTTTHQEVYEFTANWQASEGADSYLLYVATDASFDAASMLSAYDGKQVLGTSYTVNGLDPYVTYYYRLRSKQAAAVSDFSASYATVNACVSGNCQLKDRTFAGWRQETYGYNTDGLVNQIALLDISSGITPIRTSQITYNTDDRIEKVTIDSAAGGKQDWEFSYENDGVGQQRIKEIAIKETLTSTPLGKMDFTYNGSGQLISIRHIDVDPIPTIIRRERYSYGSDKITATDSSGVGIKTKETTLGDDFNTESLLLSDLALLLFNPTDPGTPLLPFIPGRSSDYYRYRDTGASPWKNYPYSYEYNAKRVPKKVRATNDIPDLTYGFDTCGF